MRPYRSARTRGKWPCALFGPSSFRHKNRTRAGAVGRGGVAWASMETLAAAPLELGGVQAGVQKDRPGAPGSSGRSALEAPRGAGCAQTLYWS